MQRVNRRERKVLPKPCSPSIRHTDSSVISTTVGNLQLPYRASITLCRAAPSTCAMLIGRSAATWHHVANAQGGAKVNDGDSVRRSSHRPAAFHATSSQRAMQRTAWSLRAASLFELSAITENKSQLTLHQAMEVPGLSEPGDIRANLTRELTSCSHPRATLVRRCPCAYTVCTTSREAQEHMQPISRGHNSTLAWNQQAEAGAGE